MRILFDSRWIAPHGIGRVAREYRDRMVRDFDVTELQDGPSPSSPADWWFLARAFRRSRADMLFVPGYNGTPLAGKRQIFIIHDLIHFGKAEPNGFRKRLYYNVITRAAAARSGLITVSQASADELVRHWPETRGRIDIVPNGISDAFRGVAPKAGAARLGLVLFGNGRWQKNLGRMLEAIGLWQRRGGSACEAPITIVGPEDPARTLADAAGVRNLVYAGRLSDEDVARLFLRSAAMLFCSHAEGFGLPVLEAVACGCPVIASDIDVLREVGQTGCVFVDPCSAHAIADGIALAIGTAIDEPARTAMIAGHDWDASYALVAAHIRELAASLDLT